MLAPSWLRLALTRDHPIDRISRLFRRSGRAGIRVTAIGRTRLTRNAAVWLASLMMLWPLVPPRACACETASTAADASCCCRSQRAAVRNGKCCKATATRTRRACCCGSSCTCRVSERPCQPSDVPANRSEDVGRRIDLSRPLPAIEIAPEATTCAACHAPQVGLLLTTAIDRCRVLSRFTI